MIGPGTVVLDTVVLAELMKPRPHMDVLRWTNAQPIGTLAVTAVSLGELGYAMTRMSDLARRIDLREALDEFVHDDLSNRVLPFDGLAADYYAELLWAREQAGSTTSVEDAQIAAICRAHRLPLATKDPAPYAGFGVTTIDAWRPPLTESSAPGDDPSAAGAPADRPLGDRRIGGSRAHLTGRHPDPAAPAAPDDEQTDRDRTRGRRRAAVDRLRQHVLQRAQFHDAADTGDPAGAADAGPKPVEPPAAEPGSGPPGRPRRRGARLLGPLVDASGSPVEQSADGRAAPRKRPAPKAPAAARKKKDP